MIYELTDTSKIESLFDGWEFLETAVLSCLQKYAGSTLIIDEVQTFSKVSDRPFFDEMSEEEKNEILKYSEDMRLPYEFIRFSRAENH